MSIVTCKNLVKIYGKGDSKVKALRGVDFTLDAGELVMLAGPSGCGKTTLISIIAGILNYDSGECTIFSRDWKNLSSSERALERGNKIGFVLQSYNLLPSLTVLENVLVPLTIQKKDLKVGKEKAIKILTDVGLEAKINSYPRSLSGGQQQRVAIARSLVHEPQLIVCDEPTSALDYENGLKVLELFRAVALKDKRSLIVVTHDQRIYHFADRIAKMDDGQIVETLTGPFTPFTAHH
jgi:putative ABC transport system ATP-binding protein